MVQIHEFLLDFQLFAKQGVMKYDRFNVRMD